MEMGAILVELTEPLGQGLWAVVLGAQSRTTW